ncbi:hypothetical protein MBLNU230_g8665t1 [Neophaeotheca triangularis]
MLAKGRARFLMIAGIVSATLLLLLLYGGDFLSLGLPYAQQAWDRNWHRVQAQEEKFVQDQQSLPEASIDKTPAAVSQNQKIPYPVSNTHHEIFSQSTSDRKYFLIEMGDYRALNPSIIAHPTRSDVWIVVAQQMANGNGKAVFYRELSCNARFEKGVLRCVEPPMSLPVTPTFSQHCSGEDAAHAPHAGPRDARVFYGPGAPYAVWGSQSPYFCLGMWTQDFRLLIDWGTVMYDAIEHGVFGKATPLQRASTLEPNRPVQKNWFLFWDAQNQVHAHYDIYPQRSFAKLALDGSAGSDLAPTSRVNDQKCYEKYMPDISAVAKSPNQPTNWETIHQATNSLSITLCKRSDPTCQPSDANTYIMTIFQHKKYYAFHSVYEPRVMLFQRSAPFAVRGISTKPLWIHGRDGTHAAGLPEGLPSQTVPEGQTLMFYVTSMSWKSREQSYSGFSDDVVFLAFGIEDQSTGGIDVLAEDLLGGLGLCGGSDGEGGGDGDGDAGAGAAFAPETRGEVPSAFDEELH